MRRSGWRLCSTGAAVAAATVTLAAGGAAGQQLAAASPCPACGHNLVLNAGAEAAPGTSDDAVVKVPDWKPTGGFTAAQYAWGGGDLSATTPGPRTAARTTFTAARARRARQGPR